MDLDKFRSQWDTPEHDGAYGGPGLEPAATVIEQLKRTEPPPRGRRKALVKASCAVLLGLAALHLFAAEGRELPVQTGAFIIVIAVLFALERIDKARQKSVQPRLWLDHRSFLQDEHRRLGHIMRLDRWSSALLSAAIFGLALYLAPFFSAGPQIALWTAGAAVVFVRLHLDFQRIARLKRSRDALAAAPGNPPAGGPPQISR